MHKIPIGNNMLCDIQICNNFSNNTSFNQLISYYLGDTTHVLLKIWVKCIARFL